MTDAPTPTWNGLLSPSTEASVRLVDPVGSQHWLETLRSRVDAICDRLDLEVGEPLAGGALSAVVSVHRRGFAGVLKVCTDAHLARAEAATLRAWTAAAASTGARRPCPEVIDTDGAAYVMSFEPGRPAHRATADAELATERVGELLEVVACTVPVPGAADPSYVISVEDARSRLTGAGPWAERWLGVLTEFGPDFERLACTGRRVAGHGDLWAGNILVDRTRFQLIDPYPVDASIHFDVARFAADGWWGPGVAARVAALCARLGLDPGGVWPLVAVFAAAQAATFTFHGWDRAPVTDGLDDCFAELLSR